MMINWFKKLAGRKNKKGETILEVLIALLVITIGAATATSLIVASLKSNLFNKDSLIALNLAQEGLEYMHNLRDTNWIKFSSDRQNCWNSRPDVTSCSAVNLIASTGGNDGYPLGDQLGVLTGAKLDLNDGIGPAEKKYILSYFDLNPAVNSDGLDIRDSGNKVDLQDDYDFIGSFYRALNKVDDSKFYRSIEIDYKNIATSSPWTVSPAINPETADMMVITSVVQWKDGPAVHQIKLSTALSRYK